jgi:flagellar hook-length control protein FliK
MRCEFVQVTEIRQASPFSETKTVAPRAPQLTAREAAPVFELPSSGRAENVRQNTVRPNPVRDAAHARNLERDALRDADKAEKLSKSTAAKAHHGHAHDGVRGAKRPADPGERSAVDSGVDAAVTNDVADTKTQVTQDAAVNIAAGLESGEVDTAPVDVIATEVSQAELVLLQGGIATLPSIPVSEKQAATDLAIEIGAMDSALSGSTATLLAVAPLASPGTVSAEAAAQVEASPAALAGIATVTGQLNGASGTDTPIASAEENTDEATTGENASTGQPAKTAHDEKLTPGAPEADQKLQAADGKAAPEAKIPADFPAVAKDVRFELPPGFSIPAPKAAHDLHGVAAPEQLPNDQPQAEGRPTPINAVPLEIGLRAMSGNKRFDIRLDPAELGRVDVRLDIDDAGNVTAKLTVDRVETLHLLQRDARTLERAFEQAGLKPSDGGVDISLRDQSGQQGSSQTGRENSEQNTRRSRAFIHIEPEIAEAHGIRRAIGPGRIDLSI